MLAVYADPSHYAPAHRGELADVLRPFWKAPPITDEERRAVYGPQVDRLTLVDEPDAADLWVLPMNWNFYYRTDQVDRAVTFVNRARAAGKGVVSWVTGDRGVPVPVEDVYVFRASGYASKRLESQYATPVVIRDPFMELGVETIRVRAKGAVPVVGFCGQAGDPFWKLPLKLGAIALRNLAYHARLRHEEPQALQVPTALRARVLKLLREDPGIDTRFLLRRGYKGRGDPLGPEVARREFLYNISCSDYTLCVRGSGNFSQRLYETLAMGRIPILINTDCILPWDDLIAWREYCVWVEEEDLKNIGESLRAFHDSLTPEAFVRRQQAARKLWDDRLSYSGFFSTWIDFFEGVTGSEETEVA